MYDALTNKKHTYKKNLGNLIFFIYHKLYFKCKAYLQRDVLLHGLMYRGIIINLFTVLLFWVCVQRCTWNYHIMLQQNGHQWYAFRSFSSNFGCLDKGGREWKCFLWQSMQYLFVYSYVTAEEKKNMFILFTEILVH